jgi:alpha-beta hydrolase superfamily lysophospholipase
MAIRISCTGRNRSRFRPVRFRLGVLGLLAVVAGVFAACAERPPALPEPIETNIVGDDGTRIAASFFPVDAVSPPGLILIHALRGNRDDWRRFARAAQRAGFASLSFDLRGHGDTLHDARGRALTPDDLTRDDWRLVTADMDAARRALVERGIDANELAVVGASLGANLGLQFAALNEDIQAVVLVSPGLVIEGVAIEDAMASFEQRPALIMFGAHDAYAASSGRALSAVAPSFREMREYATSAHGTALFDVSDQALEQAIYWLGSVLRGAGLPGETPLADTLP